MLIKPKLEYTALLGDKIDILQCTLQRLQDFAIGQSISEFVFTFRHVIEPEDFKVRRLVC